MPQNQNIILLSDARKTDLETVGGKAANLGELIGAEFPVPAGFIVTTCACEKFFKTLDLDKEFSRLDDAPADKLKSHAEFIAQRITSAKIPDEIANDVLSAYHELSADKGREFVCAVRSSATSEDSAEASFAGQYQTFYGVTEANLPASLKRCWASLWSLEAVSYRRVRGMGHESARMAVIVQEMVRSDVSGVAFTLNPSGGDANEMVIDSAFGMGSSIADGRVTPDRYVVNRDTLTLKSKRISDKKLTVPPDQKGQDAGRFQAVAEEKRRQDSLELSQVKTISEWAMKAEKHFQAPQDIEWAFARDKFYILQSRPISTMDHEDEYEAVTEPHVLFKPIADNFTDPFTPLSADLSTLGIPSNILQVIGGRFYMAIKLINAVMPLKLNDREKAEMIYSGDRLSNYKYSLLKIPLTAGFLMFLSFYFSVIIIRSGRMPDGFMDNYRKLADKIGADPSFGPADTIRRLWSRPKFFDPIGYHVQSVNVTSARTISWTWVLRIALKLWLPDLPEGAEVGLTAGSKGMLSTAISFEIKAMTETVRKSPRVMDLFIETKPSQLLERLKGKEYAKEFLEHLEKFLKVNGHRGPKEWELISPRWEENPTPVLGMIKSYLAAPDIAQDLDELAEERRKELENEVKNKLQKLFMESSIGFRWRAIKFFANRVRYFTRNRENSRYYYMLAFYMVRKKILALEEKLISMKKLKGKDDIFFLYLPELEDLEAGKLEFSDIEDKIHARRMRHIRRSKTAPPKIIGFPKTTDDAAISSSEGSADTITGISASGGKYTGPAHVITDPSADIELKPGEVLVAPYMGPTWTPLFLTAGAAVVEVGSFLSHAGTVAREFGLPCVVEAADCTRRIRTGDMIEVDGDLGIVRLLPASEID